ncbi:60S ribosomal protein L21 [Pseudoloma neurophilia]|uniref:60S ribosomal protein L21 n=1 Tax=Pseudoloma neurophilia TaxID=146866 RepID=A0A0R0LYA7_9MICR|nr:60S ribosomal protein L21 [Pseudoloma neurophilia]
MVSSKGYRRQTRKKFSQSYRKRGLPNPSTYLQSYKRGDYVDIKVNPAVHKGMPHKYYHGLTGKVAVVHNNSLTIRCTRRFGNKRIFRHIVCKIDHVKKSNCDKEFIERRNRNEALRKEYKLKNKVLTPELYKRQPKGPRQEYFIDATDNEPVEIGHTAHVDVY